MQIRRRRTTRDQIPALAGPPPNSLRVQASTASEWIVQTASNNLLVDQTTCSLAFAICINAIHSPGQSLIWKNSTQDINVVGGGATLTLTMYGTKNLATSFSVVAGQVYFIVASWSPTIGLIYSQAQVIESVASPGTTEATNEFFQLGFPAAAASDFSINQLAIWHGYALSQSDALYLRSGGSPAAVSPANLKGYWTLSGTYGANPHIASGSGSDPGFLDQSGNGHHFTSLTGTSTLATYGGPLVYTPPTLVTPYISKSGQTAYFFTLSNASPAVLQDVQSITANPTVSVQFGGSGAPYPVQAQGPYWLPENISGTIAGANTVPFVTYQLSCGPVQSIVVQDGGSSYSSPSVSITGGGGSGATATATVAGGVITGITVTAAGSGYNSPPSIVITDADGSGAAAVPVMAGVQSSDVVTYSAPDGWITASSGPAPAAPSAYTSDTVGELRRPARGGHRRLPAV